MELIELDAIPSLTSLYLKAMVQRRHHRVARASEQALARVNVEGVRVDADNLREYCQLCGFDAAAGMAVTFPFVLVMPLQLQLLVSDAFPYPVFGLIHVSNDITRYGEIPLDRPVSLECTLFGPRLSPSGQKFDFVTRLRVDGDLLWECRCVTLRTTTPRMPATAGKRRPQRRVQRRWRPDEQVQWHLPANLGRRFGVVSGDVNPIHLHRLSARLFGFPDPIVHGMWLKARCLAELAPRIAEQPVRVKASFRQPVFLPGEVQFGWWEDGSSIRFEVRDQQLQKVHVRGELTSI